MAKTSAKREPTVELALGETGVGKTYQTLQKVFRYIKTIKRPVVIIDFQDEYTLDKCGYNIPTINIWPNARKKWAGIKDLKTVTVVRVPPKNADGTTMSLKQKNEALQYILRNFRNGKIVIDDIDKYAVFNTDQDMVGSLMGNRQPGLDIIITHQSFGVMTTMECRNLNIVRLHHTSDTPSAIKDKLQENLEILEIAYTIVKDQYEMLENHRYFLYINTRKKKMWGCTKRTFTLACDQYIFKSRLIKPTIEELIYLRKIDRKQKNSEEAEQMAKKHLMAKFERYFSDKPVIANN